MLNSVVSKGPVKQVLRKKKGGKKITFPIVSWRERFPPRVV